MRGAAGMGDLGGMMREAQKHVKELERRMRELDDELRDRIVEGSAGGGMVRVMINAMREPVDVKIDPQVFKEESPEFVQEMILAAMRQGLKKAEELEKAERAKVTGKLNIPGLDGLL